MAEKLAEEIAEKSIKEANEKVEEANEKVEKAIKRMIINTSFSDKDIANTFGIKTEQVKAIRKEIK